MCCFCLFVAFFLKKKKIICKLISQQLLIMNVADDFTRTINYFEVVTVLLKTVRGVMISYETTGKGNLVVVGMYHGTC